MMEFGVVVVGVDSKDKYTKKEENVSNHEHLQFNHNIDHHHTRKTTCAARYDERYVHSAIAEGAKKQHPCPASSSSSYSSSSSSSRGVVVIDGSFGMGFSVVVVVDLQQSQYPIIYRLLKSSPIPSNHLRRSHS